MTDRRKVTESRLEESLERLLKGKTVRVKATGKLTLNKVNREAGLGNSYVHKFPDFVEKAKPIIDEYNENKAKEVACDLSIGSSEDLADVERLKCELQRERRLKEKYRNERDDAKFKLVTLTELNSRLMWRLHELQENLGINMVTKLPSK